jgi:hypothetical protein
MKLTDLLESISRDTTVWIATSPEDAFGIYFNEVRFISDDELNELEKYTVKEIYPEHYPACYCHGITIIVEKENELWQS